MLITFSIITDNLIRRSSKSKTCLFISMSRHRRRNFETRTSPVAARTKIAGARTLSPPSYGIFAYSQADPWNLNEHDVIEAMQLIWNKLYGKAIPYQITAQDAVCVIVSHTISEVMYTNFTSPRPCSAPVTHGETLWHPPHRRVLRPSLSPTKSSTPMIAARRSQLTT